MNFNTFDRQHPVTTRILVTGATGFLGGHILQALQKQPNVTVIAACRTPERLPVGFQGEVRVGDLLDEAYRHQITQKVDVICHAGTWGAFWGHHTEEREHFYEPALDLMERAIEAGVKRFLLASTVAIAKVSKKGAPVDDFSETSYKHFWPHVDRLIDLDNYMKANRHRGMQMVNMRLGHFVGKGNRLGMVPALIPRLRTYMVPWLAGGRKRMAVVTGEDLGESFALASVATGLDDYESFNICGNEFPSSREVISFIARESRSPKPWFSVPYSMGYAFGWLMEKMFPILPGSSPFLTRSLVLVSEDWHCPTEYAKKKIGYLPKGDWRDAIRESLFELAEQGYPWPQLAQSTKSSTQQPQSLQMSLQRKPN